MGNQDNPGGPPKGPPAPIRLKSTDPKDPPDHLDNAAKIGTAPVTNTPDAQPSDATMSQEVEMAVGPETVEEPEIVLVSRTFLEHATPEEKLNAAAAAAEKSRALSEKKERERSQRRKGADLRVVDEWTAGDEEHDLETLTGQILYIQQHLQRFVDVSSAPYMGDDGAANIQRIVKGAPSRLTGRDLAVITRVLLGNMEPRWEFLGYAVDQFVRAQRLASLQENVEFHLLAREVNESRDEPGGQPTGAFLPEAEDLEEILPPTVEEMSPYWDLVPEIERPEGEVVFGEYGEAMDAIAEGFPAMHLDEDPRAEAIADLALALTGVRIPLKTVESSVRILRGESTEEATSMGARFPIVDTPNGPLLNDDEKAGLDAAVSGLADPVESELDSESFMPKVSGKLPHYRDMLLRPLPPEVRRREREARELDKPPTPARNKERPVRKVKREQLVPVSALWSLAALVLVLACVITAVLLREDTKDRRASLSKDTAQDVRADGFEMRQDEFDEDLGGVIAQIASQKSEVVSLTRERDGFQSLADQSVTVVGELRTEVNDLERDTRRRVSSVATDLSATQRDIRELRRQMQGGQGRERELERRLEATETMATSMVKTQKCPSVGSGTLTSRQAGTVFECRQAGAKAFVICIGPDSASAHSCQMTTAPK